ncbi:MAG: pentapeptide repeat-containing protein [Proteobacteria bacterium]|nr:pentapeptide repeat-containing protein [Pseudomonadota bacterium]
MGGASFLRTSFKGADLRGAYFRVAKFDRAVLSGANLRGARGLIQEQIDNAICDTNTRLPDDLIAQAEDVA